MQLQQHVDIGHLAYLHVTKIAAVQNARAAEVKDTWSGRVSKLTERFSLYRAGSIGVKQQAASEDVNELLQCDEDLAEVAAALCHLGQPHSNHAAVEEV